MALELRPFTPELVDAVERFNERLLAGGFDELSFPASPLPEWLPKRSDADTLYQELFVATDERDEVRGGYMLKHQRFRVAGEERDVGNLSFPLSEGIVDRRYAPVGLRVLRDITTRSPVVYGLDVGGATGGWDAPLAKMLVAARWAVSEVPFFFRVLDASAFLRKIEYVRTSRLRRAVLDVAAATRLAAVPLRTIELTRDRQRRAGGASGFVIEPEFGAWSDDVWQAARSSYVMVGERTEDVLDKLFPAADDRFVRVRVLDGATTQGWALVMVDQLAKHKHYGSMRLGSIVDGLSLPGKEAVVISAATAYLRERGAELAVTHQNAAGWGRAMRENGYFRGPSNLLLACSPALSELLDPLAAALPRVHMTRGDGEGPIRF